MSRSPITCHVLDSSIGKPASGVEVILKEHCPSAVDGGEIFEPMAKGNLLNSQTDADGRCTNLLSPGSSEVTGRTISKVGIYKIMFKTKEYFETTGRKCFYPWVEITFEISNPSEHYHVPLLISPYSYTTYRGS